MKIQINTNISALQRNNAIANLNSQMKKIQINAENQDNPSSINKDIASLKFTDSLNSKVKQLDKEKENLEVAKNKLASVGSQLKSIQNELKQVSGTTPDLSEIVEALKVIGSETNSNIGTKNNSVNDQNKDTNLDSVLGNFNKLEQNLDSKDDFLTFARANSQASLSKLLLTDKVMQQLNDTEQ